MKNFVEYSLAYGVLKADQKVVNEALLAGADPQTILMDRDYHGRYSEGNEKISALGYAWEQRGRLGMEIYTQLEDSLNRIFDNSQFELVRELLKTPEGLNFLKKQVEKGLVLKSFQNSDLNNLLHTYFLDSSDWSSNNLPVESLEFLLQEGVDAHKLNRQGKTPLHCVKTFKRDTNSRARIKVLKKYKVDLTLTDTDGKSILMHLVEADLQSQEVLSLLKKTSLENVGRREIQAVLNRDRVSDKLMQAYIQRGALDEYKMLEYINPDFKNMSYWGVKSLISFTEEFNDLLKESKLKDFLKNVFGVASSQLTNAFLEFHKQTMTKEGVNYSFIHAGMVLKRIFIDDGQNNSNDLLKYLSSSNVRISLDCLVRSRSLEQAANFFKVFNSQQIKILLDSIDKLNIDKRHTYDNPRYGNSYYNRGDLGLLTDAVEMFWKFPQELTQMIKEIKFSNLNTITKLHDFLAQESTKLQHLPFDLNQEEHHKSLKFVHEKEMEDLEGFKIFVAQKNYDLINWGVILHNCVGGAGYAEKAKTGKSVLVGILQNDEVKYCVEIIDKKINQIEGKCRSKVPKPITEAFIKTMQKHHLLNKENFLAPYLTI